MATRSLTRELALLVLGQVPEQKSASVADLALDSILDQALDTLTQHWRESLDASAAELDQAQQSLLDSELQQGESGTHDTVRTHLRASLSSAEQVLNGLSASLELPRLLLLGDQEQIRRGAMERVQKVLTQREGIDKRLDQVMEGWRLTRLRGSIETSSGWLSLTWKACVLPLRWRSTRRLSWPTVTAMSRVAG